MEWSIALAAGIALALFIIEHGFYLAPQTAPWFVRSYEFFSGFFLISAFVQLGLHPHRWFYLSHHPVKYILSIAMLGEFFIIVMPAWLTGHVLPPLHLVLLKLYILTNIGRRFLSFSQYIARYSKFPARVIVLSFVFVILVGSWLLMLPKATTTPIRYIDALFTSTSAVCVTGLIVVDTSTAFTRFGQLIIISLIQIGGLGLMTITAFFSLLIGQRMSGREQVMMGDTLSTERYSSLSRVIHSALWTTLVFEAAGMAILFLRWRHEFTPDLAVYTAFFHAVSAFCNAGFSTFPTSMMAYVTDVPINLTICGLIILGGLGFETHRNLQAFVAALVARKKRFRFSVQARLVLIVTVILLGIGMVAFALLEWQHALKGLPVGGKLLASFFQSVTPRTAGFNTVDYAQLQPATLMTQIMLMFIGVGPGSTGGGIKVTTFAILVMTVVFASQGRTRIEIFNRTIPVTVLYQTVVVFTMYLVIVLGISTLLLMTEASVLTEANGLRTLDILFETNSALGTVGLSTGVTSKLSGIGKGLMILTMFLGRVGPFTLALAIARKPLTEQYQYPEEKVQIG